MPPIPSWPLSRALGSLASVALSSAQVLVVVGRACVVGHELVRKLGLGGQAGHDRQQRKETTSEALNEASVELPSAHVPSTRKACRPQYRGAATEGIGAIFDEANSTVVNGRYVPSKRLKFSRCLKSRGGVHCELVRAVRRLPNEIGHGCNAPKAPTAIGQRLW